MKLINKVFALSGISLAMMAVPQLPAQVGPPASSCSIIDRTQINGVVYCYWLCKDGSTYIAACQYSTK